MVEQRSELVGVEDWKGSLSVQLQQFLVLGQQAVGQAGVSQLDELLVVGVGAAGASGKGW